MNILFDQGVPVPLRRHLVADSIATVYEQGWSTLINGALLSAAEDAGFTVLITTDQNLRYQQNLRARQIAIVVLMSTSWPRIQRIIPTIVTALATLPPHGYREIEVPFRSL